MSMTFIGNTPKPPKASSPAVWNPTWGGTPAPTVKATPKPPPATTAKATTKAPATTAKATTKAPAVTVKATTKAPSGTTPSPPPPPPEPTYSTPPSPSPFQQPVSTGATISDMVKIATPDLIIGDTDTVPGIVISSLNFQEITGTELIGIARHDILNGQEVLYSPIKNLSEIALQYNPNNMISLQYTSESIFKNFPINLNNYVPAIGAGPESEGSPSVYWDSAAASIIVNIVGIGTDEQVEVEILKSGSILNDTIY